MFGKKEKVLYGFNVSEEYEDYKLICEKNPKCMTYDLWEKYILSYVNNIEIVSIKNLKHYLINEKYKIECSLKKHESLYVPAFIGFVAFYMTFIVTLIAIRLATGTNTEADYNTLGGNFYLITNLIVIGYFIAIYLYFSHKIKELFNKITFFNDVINIIDNYEAEKSE